MERRVAGAALLVVTLIATLVLTTMSRPKNQGEALPIPLPDAPTRGMCAELEIVFPTETAPSAPIAYDEALDNPFGPCSPTSTGQVVEVIDAVQDIEDANARCRIAMNTFVGLPENGAIEIGGRQWLPANQFRVLPIGPTHRQRAAGQHWTACVLVLLIWASPQAQASIAHYQGPALDSFAGAPPNDHFGVCLGGDAGWTPCLRPHPVQVFGDSWGLSTDTTKAALDRQCRSLATRLSGAPDPTFGGRVEIFTNFSGEDDNGKKVDRLTTGANVIVTCGVRVVAGRDLIGSLIGIGAGEPHWSS